MCSTCPCSAWAWRWKHSWCTRYGEHQQPRLISTGRKWVKKRTSQRSTARTRSQIGSAKPPSNYFRRRDSGPSSSLSSPCVADGERYHRSPAARVKYTLTRELRWPPAGEMLVGGTRQCEGRSGYVHTFSVPLIECALDTPAIHYACRCLGEQGCEAHVSS